MNINAEYGHKVVYTGCSDEQINFGGCDNPRDLLVEGEVYVVHETDIHSYHTKVMIRGITGKFNSVCFEDYVEEVKKTPEQWADEQHILILDPSGWRKGNLFDGGESKDFREPIAENEFNCRLVESTIMSKPEAQE